jgi:hypothetical protein
MSFHVNALQQRHNLDIFTFQPGHPILSSRGSRNDQRLFSTTADTNASASSSNSSSNKSDSKRDNSSLFFDNLGKIFLLVIGSVIASLVRSSAGTRNRNNLRDYLEDIALIDPAEIEDLRIANSLLDASVFRSIMKDVQTQFPNGICSYNDFVYCVRKCMVGLKGEAFTIELGHMIDRLIVEVLTKHNVSPEDSTMPVSLFLTALTMAMYSETSDRIRTLYEVLQMEEQRDSNTADNTANGITIAKVRSVVEYLQDTCQLPPDTQIVPTEVKYPAQQWRCGKPEDLVPWTDNDGTKSDQELIDLFTFASILRSKSVCAWGECYIKRKFEEEDV